MSEGLKPCPFCGSEARLLRGGTEVVCSSDGETGCNAVYFAVSDWSRRPVEDALRARAEAAEADLDALARTVGAAIVAGALAPGESLTSPPQHAIVSTVNRLRARAEAAEARAAQAEADARLMLAERYYADECGIFDDRLPLDECKAVSSMARAYVPTPQSAWAEAVRRILATAGGT